MKIRFFLTIITFLFIICMTAVFIVPSGATEPEAAEPETLPCLNEQEHQWSDFVFTGEGLHSAECIRCGAVITENCVFSNEPSFLPERDGTHSESCLICGGKRITPCQYREETVSPTEFEEGYTLHTCVLCSYSFIDERKPAESAREQSGLMGDVDRSGIIEPGDARALLRCSVRLEALPTDRLPYADLDGDGVISPGDARLALRASVKLDPVIRHAYEIEVTEQPDCEKDGALNCRCTYCGDSHVIAIPAFGHKYQCTFSSDATCVKAGKQIFVCEICQKKKEIDSPAFGHSWQEATLSVPKKCSRCGEMITGWTEVGGKTVYFRKDGTVPPGDVVLFLDHNGVKCNWYLKNGILDRTVRAGITIDGVNWIVTEGKAKKAVSEADKTLFRAFLAMAKATNPEMTKEQKLRACFNYVKTAYGECSPRSPHYLGADWPVLYANDMFVNGRGNCFSYAAAFGYMAKAIGYEEVYCCNSTGHGWTEIDGKVYDPEWSKGNFNSTFFGISYYDNVGVNYKVILPMIGHYDYAHVKL